MPRPSSATDRRKPTPRTAPACTTMRRARAWRTALVSASCAMPMISRSTPASNAGSSSITSSTGTSLVRCARSTMRRSAAATSSRSLGLRPQRRHRAARLDQVRAREIDRGLEAARRRRRQARRAGRAAPPAAASGWRRSPAPACRGCRARCGCALRAPPGAAPRAGSDRRGGCSRAPASPAAPSRRAARDASGARTRNRSTLESAIQPSVCGGSCSGATSSASHAGGAVERAHRLRQPRVVAVVLEDRGRGPRRRRAGAGSCSRAAGRATPSRRCRP